MPVGATKLPLNQIPDFLVKLAIENGQTMGRSIRWIVTRCYVTNVKGDVQSRCIQE